MLMGEGDLTELSEVGGLMSNPCTLQVEVRVVWAIVHNGRREYGYKELWYCKKNEYVGVEDKMERMRRVSFYCSTTTQFNREYY
jgi:hypothetical protein